MTNHIFTPRDKDGNRLAMLVNDEDKAKTGRGQWLAKLTDQRTGKTYLFKGAPCNIKTCFCDAEIVQELKAEEVGPRIFAKFETSKLSKLFSDRIMILEETELSYLVRYYNFYNDDWDRGSRFMDKDHFHKNYVEAY